jgi:hypothetical protein
MLTSRALLAFALLVAAGSRSPATQSATRDHRLVFVPKEGTRLARKAALRMELGPGSEEFRVRGEAREIDGRGRRYLLERRVRWTDRFGPVHDGRALELERSFDSIGGGMSAAEPGDALPATDWRSDLEGTVVKLAWDADEERYGVRWREKRPRELDELLGGLREDADLRGLLPAERVAVGARWEIEPSSLRDVLLPLGDLAIGVEECESLALAGLSGFTMPLPPANLALWFDAASGTSSGGLAARLTEVTRAEGRELAHVSFDVDLSFDLDHAAWLTARIPREYGIRVDRHRMRVALDGKAELVWDIDAGHATSFELEARVELELDMAWSQGSPSGALDLAATASRSGPLELTFEVEPAP